MTRLFSFNIFVGIRAIILPYLTKKKPHTKCSEKGSPKITQKSFNKTVYRKLRKNNNVEITEVIYVLAIFGNFFFVIFHIFKQAIDVPPEQRCYEKDFFLGYNSGFLP